MTRPDLTPDQREAYRQEQAYWQRMAESHFEEADLAFIRWHQERLLQILELPPEAHVVEVGCGSGKLFREHRQVLLLDFSAEILARARRQWPHMEAVCASVHALPFRDGSLRCLVANNMLHHVKGEGLLQAAVREFERVLAPDGRLYVNDRNPTLLHHAVLEASNAAKRLLRNLRGEFAGCGSFNEPAFLRRDWELLARRFTPERHATYYSLAMWAVDSLAKALAVLLRRPRGFVDRWQRRALVWLGPLERLPGWLHIERTVVYRARR